MLECSDFSVYDQGAPTHLGVGLRTPSESTNRVLSRCALFLLPVVYDRLCSGDSSRRPLAGSSNSVQSVALIRTSGGSSLKQQEDTIMDDVRYAVWLFSQLSDEDQQFILIFLRTWIEFKEANNGH